jgi:endonuclease III
MAVKKKNTKPTETQVRRVFERLDKVYPHAKTELTYENPFQLIISVILSAQCTDARVNQTTPHLFARFPTAAKLAKAEQAEVEKIIHSCGFYRAKSKAIISTARDLTERFSGEVPRTLDELVTLSGVGRKTASVVLNQAFDIPAIAVDTHVKRVAQRLGWATSDDPTKIEFELRDLVPMKLWGQVNTLLILHGRRTCASRKPKCEVCLVKEDCAYFSENYKETQKNEKKSEKAKKRSK